MIKTVLNILQYMEGAVEFLKIKYSDNIIIFFNQIYVG